MIADLISTTISNLNLTTNDSHALDLFLWKTLYSWQLFAQQVDVDLWSDVQKAWNNFIECGQVWALLVGLVIGWMVKSIFP